MATIIAVAMAVGGTICFNYGAYLQKVVVVKLPKIELNLKWSVLKAFLTNKQWLIAIGVTVIGAVFYAVAITMAPVSIVQPIVGAGVALLAYLAIKNLGEKPRKQDLIAIGMSILGVILIGVSLAEGVPKKAPPHKPGVLWIFCAVVVLLAAVIPLLMRGSGNRQAAGLGISVGLLFGLTAIFARLMFVDWANQWSSEGILVLFSSVFLLGWALAYFPALLISQAALQRGMAIIVMPLVAGLSQVIPIVGGMLALGEKFPKNTALIIVRIIAFCMILVATVILSRRAEEELEEAPEHEEAVTPQLAPDETSP
jgi:drug/metabolite transporter (DMT)-like permease